MGWGHSFDGFWGYHYQSQQTEVSFSLPRGDFDHGKIMEPGRRALPEPPLCPRNPKTREILPVNLLKGAIDAIGYIRQAVQPGEITHKSHC